MPSDPSSGRDSSREPPSRRRLSRRRLLGGLAAGGVAAYSGYRFLPAGVLPAPLLGVRTARRSVPAVETALPVSPEALADSRDHLRAVIDRAEAAWDEVDDADVDSEREEFDRSLEGTLDVARETLDETEDADPTTDALSEVRYGLDRAAWSLAAARAITEDYDPAAVRERSAALSEDVESFADAVSYEVADPRRGLAFLYRTERALFFARLKADNAPEERSGREGEESGREGEESGREDEGSDGSRYDHGTVVSALRSEVEGRRWLADARAVYDSHRANVADTAAADTADLESHLDGTWRTFADRIDGLLPGRETAIERYLADGETTDEGPRETAANQLFNNGYMAADDARSPDGRLRDGLLALAAVEHAEALQHARGFEAAAKRLDAAFADGEVGMALAARTKREAVGRLRDLLADGDDPVTRELAARPREEVVIGDWPIGFDQPFESEHPHAEAYAMYLLAAENLRYTAEIRDALVP